LLVWLVLAGVVGAVIWFDPVGQRRRRDASGSGSSTITTPNPLPARVEADAFVADAAVLAERDVEAPPIDAPPAAPLYTITEALDDVAASPLEFIGTGAWFGNASIHACAYHNARVIVVNEYCTANETPALGLIVISPTRGRLSIYAEADAAISTLTRADYQTFNAEVQPALQKEPVTLEFTYAELNAWEERRYNSHEGACWYANAEDSCSGGLQPQLKAWTESAKPFITEPPASWYRLTKDLHARAARDLRRKSR
jgi:hypothetical protein